MPTITKGDKVLVSGANGYIAMWVVRTLLERGYTVRGTVRNASKAKFMDAYFSSLGYGDKFESVIVEDIMKVTHPFTPAKSHHLTSLIWFHQDGAFDEAVKGVDAIAHTASPFHGNVQTHDGMLSGIVNAR